MYAIEERGKKINGVMVDTFARKATSGATELDVETGTTGYRGGCSREAGGRTYLSIECYGGDFYFSPIQDDAGNNVGVTIACCGDDGMVAIAKALAFCKQVIDDQRIEMDD